MKCLLGVLLFFFLCYSAVNESPFSKRKASAN